jgi:primosomal protein N' (replication factor Y)
MTVEVIPFVRLPKSLKYFDYKVPQDLEEKIRIGQIVKIHFRGRLCNGLVTKIKSKSAIAKQIQPVSKIIEQEPQINSIHLKLIRWLADYYFVSPALIVKTFIPEPLQFLKKIKKNILKPISLKISKSDVPVLKADLELFFKSKKRIFLFHYQNLKFKNAFLLKIIEKFLKENKQILILEPQISDINFILPYFSALFFGKVAVLHNELSKTEYWQEWKKIQKGQALVVFGTRSSILAPFKNLKLIIIDDEEMSDFKSEQNPRYDSRQIALKLANLCGAKIIFTSQAPRLTTYYNVKIKKYCYLANSLIKYTPQSYVTVLISRQNTFYYPRLVDMNQEIKSGNFQSLSLELQELIQQKLQEKKKVILLLNRRGMSTLVFCRDCGHVFECPNCKLPLVCHKQDSDYCNELVCHHCSYKESVPLLCPSCQGTTIKFFGTGTQRVENEIKKIFPQNKVIRIDKDVKIPDITQKLQEAEIIIGTQFFIKNYLFQIKNVGFIGVVSADTLLFRPDFRSSEKTFEWLTKLINLNYYFFKVPILFQTFFPNNFAIRSALNQDYRSFAFKELEERQKFNYPPFGILLKLILQEKKKENCDKETKNLFEKLKNFPDIEFVTQEKSVQSDKKYISTIVLKIFPTKKVSDLLKIMSDKWMIDREPEDLL